MVFGNGYGNAHHVFGESSSAFSPTNLWNPSFDVTTTSDTVTINTVRADDGAIVQYSQGNDGILTVTVTYSGAVTDINRFCRQSFVKRTPEEEKALATLRDLVTEKEFRRYLTNGFHVVRGVSGNFYQIYNDQRPLKVYRNNKKVSSICIHTDKDCPPTDHVLNIMYMLHFDERGVWSMGNVTDYQSQSSDSIPIEPQLGQVIGMP